MRMLDEIFRGERTGNATIPGRFSKVDPPLNGPCLIFQRGSVMPVNKNMNVV